MLADHRPVLDGLDNVIGFDTFDADGKLIRRFNTEDEAIDYLLERDKPYKDPRKGSGSGSASSGS